MRLFDKALGNNVKRLIKNMNLRKKILLLYILIVVIPVIILGLIASRLMFNYLKKDYVISVNEAVDQLVKNIEFRRLSYELLVTRTATDGELIARLVQDFDDFYLQWETINYIDRSFGNLREYLPGIDMFRIYHHNKTLVQDGGVLWKPENRIFCGINELEWYESVIKSNQPMVWDIAWDATGDVALTLSQKIWSANQAVGCVFIRVKSSLVFDSVINSAFHGNGDIYLLNENGVIFSSSNTGMMGKYIADTALKGVTTSDLGYDSVMEIEGNTDIIVSKPVFPNWRIIAAVPLNSLETRTKNASAWIISITLCLIFLSAVLMMAVINNLVLRLRKLEHKMAAVTKGKFNVAVTRQYGDELGDLEGKFNIMASRLGDLTNEIAVTRSKEREEALNALQAQINPHFLYNTLGIIRWKALDINDDALCQLVDAITVFYRLSLNKGNSILRISDELEHVKAYLQIQQFRYLNNVTVNWDIDPEVLPLYTIKLILQPIVENCYIHGMIAKKGRGVLNISALKKEDSVVFTVRDNGLGIPEEVVARIKNGNDKANSGYGLMNIKERLRLYFGQKAMLHLESRWGEGTVVSITIPVCTEPPGLGGGD